MEIFMELRAVQARWMDSPKDVCEHVGREESSPGFDIERPDHFAPLLGLVGDELAEVGRGQRKHRAAQVGEASTELGIGKARIDLFVELVDDLCGGTLWRPNAVPRAHLIAWNRLAYGGNVLCRLGSHRACD